MRLLRLEWRTNFDSVRPDVTIARNEILGPVPPILTVASPAEAVKVANDTFYGDEDDLARCKRSIGWSDDRVMLPT